MNIKLKWWRYIGEMNEGAFYFGLFVAWITWLVFMIIAIVDSPILMWLPSKERKHPTLMDKFMKLIEEAQ
jgi:hypothetical protein